MRIGLTGATGFIGSAVCHHARQRGHEIIAYSRDPSRTVAHTVETRAFTPESPLDVEGCEGFVHLAGEPIPGIWTSEKRRRILKSRIQGTRRVVEGIARAKNRPEVLVSASGVGYYGEAGDQELTESSPMGHGFLAETADAWEREAFGAREVRTVALRIALVLGRGGGALPPMSLAFRLGLGAAFGSGQQWMPWIHLEDLARLIVFCVEDLRASGPINACAPWPVRNHEFTRTLGRVLQRPTFFRIPAPILRFAMGGLSAELLESKRAVPAAATDLGFGFKFPELEPALRDAL